ncbi:MAG: CinA family nicotinamide mononucleotide deamidase-related protein, partial [Bacteroidota bacterium]|nr:CinA family nicotinamide mononucleotide deamidase-related protein [Bacteroidota bacterium]
DEESKNSDIILITGGLGPTADDITKPLLCEYFGCKLVVHEQTLTFLKYLFKEVLKRPLTERNLKQAEVPDGCSVLFNEKGTAPGMWFEKDEKIFVAVPGVPFEMKGIMSNFVLPALQKQFDMPVILHQTLMTSGIGESFIADHIKEWEEQLPAHIKLAYLPNYGMVRLRLTAQGNNKNELEKELEKQFATLKQLVAEWLVIDEDLTIEEVVGKLLKERKQTVGTAESCTGGYIAHLLTVNAGASSNYKGTVVSYDNKVKEDIINVSHDTLEAVGAVSEEIVKQMAEGVLKQLKSDYAISTSGIMGPDGGSEKKPIGMVWIAVGNKNKIEAKVFHFRFDRLRNIERTSQTALDMLRKFIQQNDKI